MIHLTQTQTSTSAMSDVTPVPSAKPTSGNQLLTELALYVTPLVLLVLLFSGNCGPSRCLTPIRWYPGAWR